jgi:WD40 repeat protein
MRNHVYLILLLGLLLGGCAGLQPAQPPDLAIPDSHLFGVTRLAFDPSGERIASAGFKGDLAVWEVPGGGGISRLKRHRSPVRGLIWLDHGRLLSAEEAGTLVISGLSDNRLIAKRETTTGLTSLAYLAQGRLILAGYANGQVRAFAYPGLEPVRQLEFGAEIVALATDHAGTRLALSTDDRQVRLLDRTLAEIRRLESPPRTALELRFSPDDRELAAGAWYNLFYWDLATGRLRIQQTEHWGAVTSLDYHPDGERLVSLGRHTDANLRLVTADEGTVLRRLQGHRLCGAAVRFSPDGRYVVSGSDDESIRLYDLSKPYRPQRVGDNW